MEPLVLALRAAGEPSRLRILATLARAELTVSELTRVLGQSQPRVSRHLKLLCEAGLLERSQEGAWAFFRIARHGPAAPLVPTLLDQLPADDPLLAADRARLAEIQREHADAAARYFRRNAAKWDEIRALHAPGRAVEAAMLEMAGGAEIDEFLDLGTGTGRILQVFGPRVAHGFGVDANREMLAIARANLERAGLPHCHVRLGDITRLPVASGVADLVTIHLVLHFLDDPGAAIAEAARVLVPGGRLIIADFARHDLEFLRAAHAHRRLGFADEEVIAWCRAAGVERVAVRHLAPDPVPAEGAGRAPADSGARAGPTLTVAIWSGVRAPLPADAPARDPLDVPSRLEVSLTRD